MELFYKKHAFSGKLVLLLLADIGVYLMIIKLFLE